MKLTGKDLYTLLASNTEDYLTWRELTREEQEEIEKAATRIHETHIAPLQGLVKEYQSLTEHVGEELDPEWFELREEADKHASLLLGEEEARG